VLAGLLLVALGAVAEPTVINRWGHSFYFPASAPADGRIPLVVYLHGCQQFRWHSEKVTQLHAWAEKLHFAVLMPEQSRLRNPWKCWNWFLGDDSLEMNEIISLVKRYQEAFPLLKTQTHVMGLSAGGVMTAHLLACRGDVFQSGAVFAGAAFRMVALPRSPLDDVWSGASFRTRGELAEQAFDCMKHQPLAHPVGVLVVHGGTDRISRPRNGEQVAAQFAGANHLMTAGRPGFAQALLPVDEQRFTGAHRTYTRTRYATAGDARVELIRIEGLGHAWSGGPSWIPFSDDEGPDGTRLALEFFGLAPQGTDVATVPAP